jgi:hypothetical protein
MAKSTRTQRARDAAKSASSNPYMRRLIEDDELREQIKNAFEAARDAYGRMQNGKHPADSLIDDKKIHKDLKVAARNLRDASERLRGKKRKRRWGRVILVGLVAAALAVILSEDLRKALLDKLFGAEEEFEYTSTTSPAPEPETTQS